jgi:hypothetical protein
MAKTKKNPSARKKLLSAIAMLTVSAVTLSTATYAWFTMNKEVQVTGMEMKTKVGANLLISDNNVEGDYTTETLSQTRKALLEPVSTVNAADGSFFYTTNALANGDAVEDVYTPYSETKSSGSLGNGAIDKLSSNMTSGAGKAYFDPEFNTTYGNLSGSTTAANAYQNAYGYVDYVFYLKATGDSTDTLIKMTELNLTYNNGSAVTNSGTIGQVGAVVDKAWRAAVFCSDISENGGQGLTNVSDSNASAGNLKAILTLNGAANQSDTGGKNYAVSDAGSAPTAMTLNYNTWSSATNKEIATVANGTSKYFKVTIRVWLEGEDTSCTSETYAQLTEAWKLNAKFELKNSSTAVTNIGSVAA